MRGLSLFAYPLCYLYSNPHELYLTMRELWVPTCAHTLIGLGCATTLTPS